MTVWEPVVIAAVVSVITVLVSRLDKSRPSLLARVAAAEERLDDVERRERLLLDYVGVLRQHIADGKPPPPPPFPPGLT